MSKEFKRNLKRSEYDVARTPAEIIAHRIRLRSQQQQHQQQQHRDGKVVGTTPGPTPGSKVNAWDVHDEHPIYMEYKNSVKLVQECVRTLRASYREIDTQAFGPRHHGRIPAPTLSRAFVMIKPFLVQKRDTKLLALTQRAEKVWKATQMFLNMRTDIRQSFLEAQDRTDSRITMG